MNVDLMKCAILPLDDVSPSVQHNLVHKVQYALQSTTERSVIAFHHLKEMGSSTVQNVSF